MTYLVFMPIHIFRLLLVLKGDMKLLVIHSIRQVDVSLGAFSLVSIKKMFCYPFTGNEGRRERTEHSQQGMIQKFYMVPKDKNHTQSSVATTFTS